MKLRTSIIAMFALVLAMGAPAVTGQNKKAQKSTQTIKKLRESLTKAKAQKDRTLTSLQQLAGQSGGNLKKSFSKFSSELKKLDQSAKQVRKILTDMRGKSQAYFQAWKKELTKINNPALQEQAKVRQAEAMKKFEALEPSRDTSRETFVDFMANLEDLQIYLGSDLSNNGIETIADLVEETEVLNQQLDKEIADFMAALDAFSAEFS